MVHRLRVGGSPGASGRSLKENLEVELGKLDFLSPFVILDLRVTVGAHMIMRTDIV